MKNFWLRRRPRIYEQINPYADHYGKWYAIKYSESLNTDLYLHRDGVWRFTTFNINAGEYTGYFNTREEIEKLLRITKT